MFPEGPAFDESPYARQVAASLGIRLHEIVPTEEEFTELLPRLVWHMDEPAAGPGLFPQYVVSGLASRHVKVALGGQGGDEIFGGYARYLVAYLEQALKGAIFETNVEGNHIVSLSSIVPNLPALREYVPMLKQFWGTGVFEDMDRRYFRLIDRAAGAVSLFAPEFRETWNPEDVFQRFAARVQCTRHAVVLQPDDALRRDEQPAGAAAGRGSRVDGAFTRVARAAARSSAGRARGDDARPAQVRGRPAEVPAQARCGRRHPAGDPGAKGQDGIPGAAAALAPRQRHASSCWTPCSPSARVSAGSSTRLPSKSHLDIEAPFSRQIWGILNLELWYQRFIDAPAPTSRPQETLGLSGTMVARSGERTARARQN